MDYFEFNFIVSPREPAVDILIAHLSEMGFDSFVETDQGVQAYISFSDFTQEMQRNLEVIIINECSISYEKKLIKSQNWNKVWESNFKPVVIAGKCSIRASFHKKPDNIIYDILIDPKMSFGTGHHSTTALMITEILDMDLKNKTIADVGCGTGVLSILASKMGCKSILAVDIDEWPYLNTLENSRVNNIKNIVVHKGDSGLLLGNLFNIILANINKNVLLSDIKNYSMLTLKDGDLLLSGFYEQDKNDLIKEAEKWNYRFVSSISDNSWALLHLKKV